MGYYINKRAGEFQIKQGDCANALEAIREIPDNPEGFMGGRYAWVPDDWRKHDNLVDMLRAWRWDAEVDDDGNIIDLQFVGEKLGDCFTMFQAIAPFVQEDSYIEMVGEDGDRWRWIFDGHTCEEKSATINW